MNKPNPVKGLNVPESDVPRIVLIGGGFAGLEFTRKIDHKMFQTVLIDERNYHTFQPLLYQVAIGGLEPDAVAFPLREYEKNYRNLHFRYARAEKVDAEKKEILTDKGRIGYDYLVIATGSRTNYFGKDQLKRHAMPLKYIPDALDLRSLISQNLEEAVVTTDQQKRKSLMTVVIAGGGPTGVELAGALSELKRHVFNKEYRDLHIKDFDIILLEALGVLLNGMSDHASRKTLEALKGMGVKVRLNMMIEEYDGEKVMIKDHDSIYTQTMIWTAGVTGNPPGGIENGHIVKGNRIEVDRYNRVKGLDDVFAVGDVAGMISDDLPKGHPLLAQPAIQQARHLTRNLKRLQNGDDMKPFNYTNKGTMATIGRSKAVVDLKNFRFHGFAAWILWLLVHLITLVGFKNKITVLIDWFYNYISFSTNLRLIIRKFERK